MPVYSTKVGSKTMGGYSQETDYLGQVVYLTKHTDSFLGKTQTMTTGMPKGTPLKLLRDPYTLAFYLPVHAVEFSKVSVKAAPLSFWYRMASQQRWLKYYEPAGLSRLSWFENAQRANLPVPTQREKDLALTMALSRVGTGPFMGAVDLGEVSKTFKFLKDPFKGLSEIFTGFTKKAVRNVALAGQNRNPIATRRPMSTSRGPRKPPQSRPSMERPRWISEILADTWLEFGYAAIPLVLSTLSLAEEATRKAYLICQRIHTARGATGEELATAYYKNPDTVNSGALRTMKRATNANDVINRKVSYVIRYAYYPWMVDAINLARFGLSPTQLVSTIHELMPLSFVGDWFVNFGQWLRAMEPKPQLHIIDVCYTQKYERTVYIRDACCGSYSYYSNLPESGADASFTRSYMKREIVTNSLQAPIPRFLGKELTLRQTLDAVSLLSRPIGNFFKRFGTAI